MITKDKAEQIAKSYIDCDFNKAQGLLGAGYARSYAFSGIGQQVYNNIQVKTAIAEIKAEAEAETGYEVVNWLKDVRAARQKAFGDKNWSAVAAFDRLLAQYTGALELDNRQRQTQLAVAVKNERVFLDDAIKQARALQGAPDAMVE